MYYQVSRSFLVGLMNVRRLKLVNDEDARWIEMERIVDIKQKFKRSH